VNPRVPLPTGSVFSTLDAGPAPPPAPPPGAPALSDVRALLDYMRAHGNDLEPAAVRLLPVIGEIKEILGAQADCSFVAMSGSGPTCFAIFPSSKHARGAAAAVAAARPEWWVECTTFAGTAQETAP
jgi:4-diphosphocytidyl-2-C-methyl-D-erythritol kinase